MSITVEILSYSNKTEYFLQGKCFGSLGKERPGNGLLAKVKYSSDFQLAFQGFS